MFKLESFEWSVLQNQSISVHDDTKLIFVLRNDNIQNPEIRKVLKQKWWTYREIEADKKKKKKKKGDRKIIKGGKIIILFSSEGKRSSWVRTACKTLKIN